MINESELLQRAQQFDADALGQIYDTYNGGVYRYALRLLGDTHLAEDCVAETFSRYLRALVGGGGPDAHLQAYLYRIAHNWITDYYRRRPQNEVALEPDLPLSDENEMDLTEAVAEKIEQERVRAALTLLTPEQRQVIMLKFLEGWDNAEIALSLRKPVGAIKALQHRALAALRRLLLPEKDKHV